MNDSIMEQAIAQPNQMSRIRRGIVAVSTASALFLAACGSNESSTPDSTIQLGTLAPETDPSTTTTTERPTATTEADEETETSTQTTVAETEAAAEEPDAFDVLTGVLDGDQATPVFMTNEALFEDNNFCGDMPELTPAGVRLGSFTKLEQLYGGSTEGMALGRSMYDITVTDPNFGMGEAAYDLLVANSYMNSSTAIDSSTGDSNVDEMISHLFRAEDVDLTSGEPIDVPVLNGTCEFGDHTEVQFPSKRMPIMVRHADAEGNPSSGTGFYLFPEATEEFKSIVRKYPDGSDMFRIVEGMIVKGDDGKEVQVTFVEVLSFGCSNPSRIPRFPETPDTPDESVPDSTDETVPTGSTPRREPKTDTSSTISGGVGSGGTGQSAPASADSPTDGYDPASEAEVDEDGDRIHIRIDKCPTKAEDYDGFEDEDGCPEPGTATSTTLLEDEDVETGTTAPGTTNAPVVASTPVDAPPPATVNTSVGATTSTIGPDND